MKKILFFISLWIVALIGTAQDNVSANKRQAIPKFDATAPIVHDPVMIKQDNTYYLYCTGVGITVLSSKNLKVWKKEQPVFDKAPEWAVQMVPGFKGHIWAPDIIFYQGQYHLFYSCSAFGKNTSAIGHATNPTLDPADPSFRWTDRGLILQSVPHRDQWNAIDPNVAIDEKGIPWLVFGSFWEGIKMVKLSQDMGTLAQPQEWYSPCQRNAGKQSGDDAVEAPFIMKHKDYYYLFVSFDYCCRGLESNYKIAVGRSKKITGPYLDKEGHDLGSGGGSIVMEGNENWAGVGHCAAYHMDGKDYLIAHGYYIPGNGVSKLVLREIAWDSEDWPIINW